MWMSFRLADNEKRFPMLEEEMMAVVRALPTLILQTTM